MPCRLCRVRGWKAGSSNPPVPPSDPQPEHPLKLELRGELRTRYEQVRRQKLGAIRAAAPADLREVPEPDEQPGNLPLRQLLDAFEFDGDDESPEYDQQRLRDSIRGQIR